jgi:hypothetical protein
MIVRAMATILASSIGGTEPWCPNLFHGEQRKERHSGPPGVDDHYHPLAPAAREATNPDNSCLGHRCARARFLTAIEPSG